MDLHLVFPGLIELVNHGFDELVKMLSVPVSHVFLNSAHVGNHDGQGKISLGYRGRLLYEGVLAAFGLVEKFSLLLVRGILENSQLNSSEDTYD